MYCLHWFVLLMWITFCVLKNVKFSVLITFNTHVAMALSEHKKHFWDVALLSSKRCFVPLTYMWRDLNMGILKELALYNQAQLSKRFSMCSLVKLVYLRKYNWERILYKCLLSSSLNQERVLANKDFFKITIDVVIVNNFHKTSFKFTATQKEKNILAGTTEQFNIL